MLLVVLRFQSFPGRDWEQSTLYGGTQQITQPNERPWLQKLASTADWGIVNRHSFQKKVGSHYFKKFNRMLTLCHAYYMERNPIFSNERSQHLKAFSVTNILLLKVKRPSCKSEGRGSHPLN
ncbi:unnamed protein product [Natator depressus]